MNEIQELEVAIDAEGRVTLHVRGVRGEKCLALTRALEERLGTVVERVATAEMDAVETDEVARSQTLGARRE